MGWGGGGEFQFVTVLIKGTLHVPLKSTLHLESFGDQKKLHAKSTRITECLVYLKSDAVISLLDVVELVEKLPTELVRHAYHIGAELLDPLEPPSKPPVEPHVESDTNRDRDDRDEERPKREPATTIFLETTKIVGWAINRGKRADEKV